jgi:hypothetical protein
MVSIRKRLVRTDESPYRPNAKKSTRLRSEPMLHSLVLT